MKEIYVKEYPECDLCGKPAKYDAPSRMGAWANFCESCLIMHGSPNARSMGSMYVKQKKKKASKPTVMGTVTVPMSWDSVVHVKCPYCGHRRAVEPDANYTVECEGCGNEYKLRSAF